MGRRGCPAHRTAQLKDGIAHAHCRRRQSARCHSGTRHHRRPAEDRRDAGALWRPLPRPRQSGHPSRRRAGIGDSVVILFPDRARAEAWYRSPAYQAILPLRTENSDSTAFLVDTVPGTYRAVDFLKTHGIG
ncbi:DUF1330 domain-containing protein [Plastoroseomonas hellenica]|uniref:DUF1330 domain-containing protein n=1 Tax=Plastoroseomonas hellenica TaxID=2687306 RepID=UPI001BA5008B